MHVSMYTHTRAQILDNVEIQHRIVESIPALHALPGFGEIRGRRLSDQEVGYGDGSGGRVV
jgi:hypothetical protein